MIRGYSYHKFLILIALIIAQLLVPRIYILETSMSFDLLLIYLTYLSTHNSRFFLVFLGFFLGLIQDIITQYELLGLFAITKTSLGFILGTFNNYNRIWNRNIKVFFLFLAYLFHFLMASYFMFDRSMTPIYYIFQIALIQTFWTFLILYIINRFILIDNKIIE